MSQPIEVRLAHIERKIDLILGALEDLSSVPAVVGGIDYAIDEVHEHTQRADAVNAAFAAVMLNAMDTMPDAFKAFLPEGAETLLSTLENEYLDDTTSDYFGRLRVHHAEWLDQSDFGPTEYINDSEGYTLVAESGVDRTNGEVLFDALLEIINGRAHGFTLVPRDPYRAKRQRENFEREMFWMYYPLFKEFERTGRYALDGSTTYGVKPETAPMMMMRVCEHCGQANMAQVQTNPWETMWMHPQECNGFYLPEHMCHDTKAYHQGRYDALHGFTNIVWFDGSSGLSTSDADTPAKRARHVDAWPGLRDFTEEEMVRELRSLVDQELAAYLYGYFNTLNAQDMTVTVGRVSK